MQHNSVLCGFQYSQQLGRVRREPSGYVGAVPCHWFSWQRIPLPENVLCPLAEDVYNRMC